MKLSTKTVISLNAYIKILENTENTLGLTKYVPFKLYFYMRQMIIQFIYHNAQTKSALIKCKITTSNNKVYTAE